MSMPPIGPTPPSGVAVNNQPKSIKFDLEQMREKAAKFANSDERVLKYVVRILENSEFQTDPHIYLDRWVKERGWTLEHRFPEDLAIIFFKQNFPCTCKSEE